MNRQTSIKRFTPRLKWWLLAGAFAAAAAVGAALGSPAAPRGPVHAAASAVGTAPAVQALDSHDWQWGWDNPGGWGGVEVIRAAPTGANSNVFWEQQVNCPIGGAPGGGLYIIHTFPATTNGVIAWANRFTGGGPNNLSAATFTPGSAQLTQVDYSFDLIKRSETTAGLAGVSIRVGVRQGGVWYVGPQHIVGPTGQYEQCMPFSDSLQQNEFEHVEDVLTNVMPAQRRHPNFTCSGGLLEFGYFALNSKTGGAANVQATVLDNWRVQLFHETCAACLQARPGTQALVECSPGPRGPSGCYRVSIPVVNSTTAPVAFASIKVSVGGGCTSPAVYQFPAPLAPGANGTVDFMWCPPNHAMGGPPPAAGAFEIAPLGADGSATCCTTTVRIVPPQCPPVACLQVPKAAAICDSLHEKGTFKVKLDLRHNFANTPVDLFVIPEGQANAHFKTYGTLGAAWQTNGSGHTRLPATGLNSLGWVHLAPEFWLSKVVPTNGQACFMMHLSAPTPGDEPCCTSRVCVKVPDCG